MWGTPGKVRDAVAAHQRPRSPGRRPRRGQQHRRARPRGGWSAPTARSSSAAAASSPRRRSAGSRGSRRWRAALAATASRESRTSLGEPVEPEVESSTARSGCRSWRGARPALRDAPPAQDDVGVVGAEPRADARGGDQDGVVADEAGQVADDRVDVVGGLEQHEPPRSPQARSESCHPIGEVVVADLLAAGDQRRAHVAPGQVPERSGLDGGSHRRRVLGKPYLRQRDRSHVRTGPPRACFWSLPARRPAFWSLPAARTGPCPAVSDQSPAGRGGPWRWRRWGRRPGRGRCRRAGPRCGRW